MQMLYDEAAEGCEQDGVDLMKWKFAIANVLLELPVGMKEMEPERQEIEYPYEGRPEIILENPEYDLQLTFSLLDKEMKPEDVRDAIEAVYDLMEEAFPRYRRTQRYVISEIPIPVGWFLMQMEDLGVEHMKAVFSAEGKMVLLTMTYRADETWKWRVLTKHILASIRIAEAN